MDESRLKASHVSLILQPQTIADVILEAAGCYRSWNKESAHMNEHQLVDSSFTATIKAPIEKIDILAWCFNLPEQEYQSCSPACVSAGFTTTPGGKRMSINVEIIGGSLMVQHYVETLGRKDHLILDSESDVFTPTGRTRIHEQSQVVCNGGDANVPRATGDTVRSISRPAPTSVDCP
jgi:hypothetical protein